MKIHLTMLLNALSVGVCHSKFLRRASFVTARPYLAASDLRSFHENKPAYNVRAHYLKRRHSAVSSEPTPNEVQMKIDATKMISAAIRAVDPYIAVRDRLHVHTSEESQDAILVVNTQTDNGASELHYNLSNYDTIQIYSFGKASAAMTLATAEILSQSNTTATMEGICIIKDDHATSDEIQTLNDKYNIQVLPASHPVPDSRSVHAANTILQSASTADERTLILVCISGGGSSLFCSPREPLSLQDLSLTNSLLLKSGMTIDKMNIVRKRLENGKGGRLAATAYPATVVTLILSDIIGDPLDLIASGPTVVDESGWNDAMDICEGYGLAEGGEFELPEEVLKLLRMGCEGQLEDTPKRDHSVFSVNEDTAIRYCENILVGNNEAAVVAAAEEADRLGYNPVVLGTRVEGEATHIAGMYVSMAEMLARQRRQGNMKGSKYQLGKLPVALIAGGETTVTLPADCEGKGGRNQELALSAALKMKDIGLRDVVLASVGTDGTDGPTDAAGAMVDGNTIARIEQKSPYVAQDALRSHDAYNYFNEVDDESLIRTGPTGTNVADICITLVC